MRMLIVVILVRFILVLHCKKHKIMMFLWGELIQYIGIDLGLILVRILVISENLKKVLGMKREN